MLHVLAIEEQGPACIVPPADDHVHVGVSRVVVVDRHPVEPRPEIPLHRAENAASVLHEVERVSTLGRKDHLPEPRILGPLPAIEAPVDLDLTLRGVEPEPLFSLALRSFAGQVAAMGPPSARPCGWPRTEA